MERKKTHQKKADHHHQPGGENVFRKVTLDERHEIEEGLRAIYGDEPQDLHVVEKGSSPVTFWLSRAIFALGAVAGLVVLSIFLVSRGWFTGKNYDPLSFSVVAPQETKSGEVVEIEIPYQNEKNTPIASLSFDVNLPPSFVLMTSTPSPANADELVYTLGNLGPRSDGVITLRGLWIADVPVTTNIQVIANYRPSNFNADFSKIETAAVATTASVLEEKVTGPESVSPGQSATYAVTVSHTGEELLKNVEVALVFPEGFTVASSVPPLEEGRETTVFLGDLEPGSETIVTVTGSYASDVTDVQQIIATAQIATSGASLHPQSSISWSTDVQGGDLRISTVVNGLTGTVTAEPGSTLRVSFRLENAGDTDITGSSVLIDFQPVSGIPLLWSTASLDGGTLTKDGVRFDAKTIGTLAPHEKKSFNLGFPLKSALIATDVDTFTITASVTSGQGTLFASPLTINVNAAVGFSAAAHYYSTDGVPIADGPLPPRVNETTVYEVMWTFTHALHDLENLQVTATLPPGVGFGGGEGADSGELTYDEVSRAVTWRIDQLSRENGNIHAKFFVKVTPEAADLGTFVKILSKTALRVTDQITGARIDRVAEELTSELPEDAFAAGKGIVTE